jgi:hypothetical protein
MGDQLPAAGPAEMKPFACVLGAAAFLWLASASAESPWEHAVPVTTADLVTAMRAQEAQGYRSEAIANSNRLLTNVFLALATQAAATDPEQRPLRIGHTEYFNALLEVVGITAESAPIHIRIPNEFAQDYLIDYRTDHVIAQMEKGPAPVLALNVKGGWPKTPHAPSSYSYEDKSSKPYVEVTHQQIVSYRILNFGDIIVCDEILGITGRVTSGALGAIFSVLGKAQVLHSRYLVAPDGMMLSRAGAKKLFTVTRTVAIYPDGQLLPELPDGRPDLEKLDETLSNFNYEIKFVPMDVSPMPEPAPAP